MKVALPFHLRLPHCKQTHMTHLPFWVKKQRFQTLYGQEKRRRWYIDFVDLKLPLPIAGPIRPKCTEYCYRGMKTTMYYNQVKEITLQLCAIKALNCSQYVLKDCQTLQEQLFSSGSYSVNFFVHYKCL